MFVMTEIRNHFNSTPITVNNVTIALQVVVTMEVIAVTVGPYSIERA